MKNKARILILTVVSLAFSFPVLAQNLYDVGNFKVSGVLLGMSPDEAKQGLVDHYTIDLAKIKTKTRDKPLPITGAEKIPFEISYQPKGTNVFVKLQPSLTNQETHQSIVSAIHMQIRNRSVEDMLKDAVELYGPYTVVNDVHKKEEDRTYLWCTQPHKTFSECDAKFPSMKIYHDQLDIHFGGYRKEWKKEVKKWKEANGIK